MVDLAARHALYSALKCSARLVIFTGAGLSTESGVPDFRTPGSPWLVNKPIPFEAFVSSAAARREAWRRKFIMDESFDGAEPSPVHRLLADLVRRGPAIGLITQNIDGLHQQAGTPHDRLIELHGNGTYAACLDCGKRHELSVIRQLFDATGQSPLCDACDGLVKSATISFGQRMPERALRQADALARECDLFLVIGSSLVVHPAAQLPMIAKANGAQLVIVNRQPTPLDGTADLVVRGEIGAAFAGLLSSDRELHDS
ncbi:SIR2 NAD-dependent protein deacetylases, SIR2 family [Rhabdaerophilaceae bacterium]